MHRLAAILAATLIAVVPAAQAGPVLELAAGLFTPLDQERDILRDGAEFSLGLAAPVSSNVQLVLSGSYARVGTVDSIELAPRTWIWSEITGSPEDWTFLNLSVDARVGWGLDGARQLWAAGGIGWYHVIVGDVQEHDSDRVWRSKSSDAPGFRLSVGGCVPLGSATRLGLVARFLVVDAATDYWDYDLTALQAQAYLGWDL